MSAAPPREIEIKLDLGDESGWQRLCGALAPPEREVLQLNRFFDTPDRDLGAARLALRLRTEGGLTTVTLKGPQRALGHASDRFELEERLDPEAASALARGVLALSELEIPPVVEARRHAPLDRLRELLRFENLRRSYRRTLAHAPRLLEVDRTTFGDGSVDFELEVELSAAATRAEVDAVTEELRALLDQAGVPFCPQPLGKLSRALGRQAPSTTG